MNNSEYTSETFIARWIAGELTEKEVAGLNEFMKREPGAMQFFDELKQAWFGLDPKKLARGLSRDQRWIKLNQKLNLRNENTNGKT